MELSDDEFSLCEAGESNASAMKVLGDEARQKIA